MSGDVFCSSSVIDTCVVSTCDYARTHSCDPRCHFLSRRLISLDNRTIIIDVQYFHDFIRYLHDNKIIYPFQSGIMDEIMK